MRALRFDIGVPRFILGKALGGVADWAVFGAPSGLRLADVPDPALPSAEWVRLEVMACGICGSDVSALKFKSSPVLEPFASFPAVLGHEILGRVVEVGAGVQRVRVGDRVAVDPSVSCLVRGFAPASPCPSCAEGFPAACARSGDEGGPSPSGRPLSRGWLVGYHRDLPGGWGERLVAHQSQLHPVLPELSDDAAVLLEPLSIGVHAALRAGITPSASVLVIGSGAIALGAIWALRATGHRGHLVAQVKRPREAELATTLGASEVVTPGPKARDALLRLTSAKPYRPIIGPEVFGGGGFSAVLDCVGTQESMDQALRFVAPRGHLVLLGCAGQLRDVDFTFLWSRELRLFGFVCYGLEEFEGQRIHTFEVTNRLLARTRAPVASLVTHRFPLSEYRQALSAAAHHGSSGSLKVVLTPT